MRINELLKRSGIAVSKRILSGLNNFEVKGISCSSGSIGRGFIFVAIKGSFQDGNNFISQAIAKGARVIVVQDKSRVVHGNKKAVVIKVRDTRLVLARLAAEFYGNPSSEMRVVGVTGTNGKTTVTYLIERILLKANCPTGVIGTVNYRFGDKIIPAKKTTPAAPELQSLLSQMQKAGCKYCIMEVSSHALEQARVEGIEFHSAVFTNLTQDHLDYHKTLEKYFQAKTRLFHGLGKKAFALINNDDKYGRRLKKLTRARVVTYGLKKGACIRASRLKVNGEAAEFMLEAKGMALSFKTRLIGIHNVYNVLAAVGWALEAGIKASVIRRAIEDFSGVPGRLERIDSRKGFSVFVDYAHTEDALKNVLQALRKVFKGRIITVFGCGGDRDKGKRPKMGRVVCRISDYAIITSDNPRSEDPGKIIADIKQGISGNNFCVIVQRRDAIYRSLCLALPGDIVLIAGKGHENYQIIKDRVLDFDDRKAVRECLRSLKY